MKSRTEDGKHTPRFIVEVVLEDKSTFRSIGVPEAFPTRAEAQAAIDAKDYKGGLVYRVRQK